MTSSADRRRPRVAGQRRRHGRAAAGTAVADTPVPDAVVPDAVVPDSAVADTPAPDAAVPDSAVVDTPVPDSAVADRPAGAPEAGAAGADSALADSPAGGSRAVVLRDLWRPLLALLAALVVFAVVAAVSLRDHDARQRDARAATAAATAALEQLLSYDYRTIGEQAARNADLLTGGFRSEYGQTMTRTIAPVAEKEKAVVQARSAEAGVMAQTADTVTVEVFVNQATTAEGEDQPSVDQNRVVATMTRVGDRWLISGLSAF